MQGIPAVPRSLWWMSVALALSHAGLTWAYLDPRFVPRRLVDGQVSVVRQIEALGPVWVVSFAVTGTAIFLALWLWPRALWVTHICGAAVFAAFAFAAWAGSFLSQPHAPITNAVMATTLAAVHMLAVWVASRTVR